MWLTFRRIRRPFGPGANCKYALHSELLPNTDCPTCPVEVAPTPVYNRINSAHQEDRPVTTRPASAAALHYKSRRQAPSSPPVVPLPADLSPHYETNPFSSARLRPPGFRRRRLATNAHYETNPFSGAAASPRTPTLYPQPWLHYVMRPPDVAQAALLARPDSTRHLRTAPIPSTARTRGCGKLPHTPGLVSRQRPAAVG